MIRCSKCILPENYPQIDFDPTGECNYCRSNVVSHTQGRTGGKEEFLERLQRLKSKFVENDKYDCMIGLSGGRDSSYVAYYVGVVLKLRPLLFVNDNGMMPIETKQNIQRIAERLNTDVVIRQRDMRHVVGKVISHWVKSPSPAMIGTFCTGCMTGINGGAMAVADEYKTHLIVTGSGGELASIGAGFPLQLITSSMDLSNTKLLKGFGRELLKNPRYAMSLGLMGNAAVEAFYRFTWRDYARSKLASISLYSFVEWNEAEINATIKRELGWQRPAGATNDWRTDCKLHRIKEYLYERTIGFTKNDVLLSCLIRREEITRKEALERMEKENAISEEFLLDACATINVKLSDLQAAVEGYKRNERSLPIVDECCS